jgi:hypothetical protein
MNDALSSDLSASPRHISIRRWYLAFLLLWTATFVVAPTVWLGWRGAVLVAAVMLSSAGHSLPGVLMLFSVLLPGILLPFAIRY